MKKITLNLSSRASRLCAAFFALSSLTHQINAQSTYTFTSAGLTGPIGPTQTQINTAYQTTNLNGSVTVTGGIQSFTIPVTGPYRITAIGGQGGYNGGYGAQISGEFNLTAGTVLKILVGQAGTQASNGTYLAGGGGGGSYVTSPANVPYVVAGGGGGNGDGYGGSPLSCCLSGMQGTTSTSGNPYPGGSNQGTGGNGGQCASSGAVGGGGAGIFGNGSLCQALQVAYSFTNGGVGGYCGYQASTSGDGGFGGGGGGYNSGVGQRGGGGGGYSGGGGGDTPNFTESNAAGGGGGSFNAGTNQTNTVATSGGSGKVIIEQLCFISLTASTPNPTAPVICSGNSVTLTTNSTGGIQWSNSSTSNSIVVSPGSTQTYSVSGTSTAGCTSSAFITVTVSAGLPVINVTTLPSNTLCLGKSATLTASGALTYTWSGGVTNAQSFTPTTTNTYVVQGENGCGTTSAVATITVAPLAVSIAATSTLICQGYTSTLTASSAVNGYTWMPGNMTGSVYVVNPTANTQYTVQASDGICFGAQTMQINTQTTPTITASTNNSVICEGDVVTLSASGAQTYVWTPGTNLTGQTVTVNPTSSTLFNVAGTNSLGCTSNANAIVIVNPAPVLSISANKPLICPGAQVILTVSGAGGGGSYNWAGGPTTAAYAVNPQTTTVYSATGTNSYNCSATESYTMPVFVPNLVISASSSSVCPNGSATLTASGAVTYSWNNMPSPASIVVTQTAATVYPITAMSSSSGVNCMSTGSIQIGMLPVPVLTLTATRTTLCKNEPAVVITANGAQTFTWTNAATTSTINASNQSTNTYSVHGTDANGCESEYAGLKITVNPCTGVGELNDINRSVKVYPNPSNGDFSITSEVAVDLKLINELGQEVKTFSLNDKNDFKVKVSGLAAGIYFITGGNEEAKLNQKIIVNR